MSMDIQAPNKYLQVRLSTVDNYQGEEAKVRDMRCLVVNVVHS